MQRKKLLNLAAAALAVGASAVSAAPALAAGPTLNGSGSTLVAPLLAEWAQGFQVQTGATVNYQAIGSGKGITQITQGLTDFGGSDAPLNPTQATACPNCRQIPWALSAVGVGYNVAGVRGLKLTGPLLAKIYMGQITNWADPQIAKVNKGVHLPSLTITPIHRSDGSGDTYAFTDYLSRINGAWRGSYSYGTTVNFPVGPGESGNSAEVGLLQTTNGGIAYIAVSYLISHKVTAAKVQNAAGNFEFPNLKNIENAAKIVKSMPANNEMHIVNPPKAAKIAYPISTFTYAIIPTNAPQGALLRQWVQYAVGPGQQFAQPLDFATLPAIVKRAAVNTLSQIN